MAYLNMRCDGAGAVDTLPRLMLIGVCCLDIMLLVDRSRDNGSADLGLGIAAVVVLCKEFGEAVRHGMVELRESLLLLTNRVVAAAAAATKRSGLEAVVGVRRDAGDVVHIGAVLADHANGDVTLAVTENDGDDEVEETKDQGQDTGGESQAPERQGQLSENVIAVERSQDPSAHGHHPHSQPCETVSPIAGVKGREGGPVAAVEFLDESGLRELADYEKRGDTARNAVGNGLEDEEAGGHVGLDYQHQARSRHAEQSNDVAGPEHVEDVPSGS